MKKKMKDVSYKEFLKWCDKRTCDGSWSFFTAIVAISDVSSIYRTFPLFRKRKWEQLKIEHYNLDVEIDA